MNVLVFGAAKNVADEIASAHELLQFDQVVAVKRYGYEYPHKIDHWVSFHPEMFADWIKRRAKRGYPECTSFWTSRYHGRRGVPQTLAYPIQYVDCEGGSSGLTGVVLALEILKATRVILAGIPMVPEAGHFNKDGTWREAIKHRNAWLSYKDRMMSHVRSMSGWTQELLGAPDRDWLLRHDAA